MKITKFDHFFSEDRDKTLIRVSSKDINDEGVLVVPDGVLIVGSFDDDKDMCCSKVAEKIKKVVLPESVHRINFTAFYNCLNLEEINIPNNVNFIDHVAFRWCEKLENVHFTTGTKLRYYNSQLFYNTKIKHNFPGCYKVFLKYGNGFIPEELVSDEYINIDSDNMFFLNVPCYTKNTFYYSDALAAIEKRNSVLTDYKTKDKFFVLCECEPGNKVKINLGSSAKEYVDSLTIKRVIPREEIVSMIFGKEYTEKTE